MEQAGRFQLVGLVIDEARRIYAYGATIKAMGTPDVDYDFAVVRFLPTGDIDTGYGSQGFAYVDHGGQEGPSAGAIDPEGRLVLVGATEAKNGNAAPMTSEVAVVRFTPDGLVDSTFNAAAAAHAGMVSLKPPKAPTDMALHYAKAVAIDENGIYVSGANAGPFTPPSTGFVFRLRPDGTLDSRFDAVYELGTRGFYGIATDVDGIAVATAMAGDFVVRRFGVDGQATSSFGVGGALRAEASADASVFARGLLIEPSGSLVVGGGGARQAATLVHFARAADASTFTSTASGLSSLQWLPQNYGGVARQCDGKLLVSGVSGTLSQRVDRLFADGTPAPSWGDQGRGANLPRDPITGGGAMAVNPSTSAVIFASGDVNGSGVTLYRYTP